jgi:hypothetical protein
MRRWYVSLVIFAGTVGAALPLPAQEKKTPLPASAVPAPQEVMALFQTRCSKCHGGDKAKAKLNLSNLEGVSRGSRSGEVVVPGKPKESLLWQAVDESKMPPKEPLSQAERTVLRRWIEQGAAGLPAARTLTRAFQPPERPLVPVAQRLGNLRTDIDCFIQAALQEKGLALGGEADRATLIRRVSFDLTGLPPTPAELDRFVADPSPLAYERMVERYLASRHYGERWGKYWLDTAGYADSNGYFDADSDRPFAYRYRDYVIESFNQDKPYDRFVQEQLAGDELAGFAPTGDVTARMAECLIATHFLRNAPDGTGESDGNLDEVRSDRFAVLEGALQITMNSLLGITIQCARCHAHKFEPISHEDYYRLQAILVPAYCPERWLTPKERVVPIATRGQREEHQRRTDLVNRQIKTLHDSLAAVAEPLREQFIAEKLNHLDATIRDQVLKAVATAGDKRSSEQKALIQQHVAPLKITEDVLAGRFPEYGALRNEVGKAIAAREKERPSPLEMLSVLVETDSRQPVHHVLLGGQHNAPGPEVQPGVPAALCAPANRFTLTPVPVGHVTSGRRSAFARWVTAPANPLFARVMVNRIWQHHFGIGLVATADNLGLSGAPPSHPDLLDYLATDFIRAGWSIKSIHRRIMNSSVYRQSSMVDARAARIDPDNRLLGHFPLLRLDAEALRDAMLAVSGELDQRLHGPYVPTQRLAEGSVEVDEKQPGARRRSVYLQQRRSQVVTLLELFDAPPLTPSCSVRTASTVPLQSLALLNSNFARLRGRAFAERLAQEAGPDTANRLEHAFRLTVARSPHAEEVAAAKRFLVSRQTLNTQTNDAENQAWCDLCQMLLASNMFLYVE